MRKCAFGACGSIFNNKLQLVGILLYVPGLDQVEVLKPPPDPFATAIEPIETVARFAPGRSLGHRIRVRGVVTLQDAKTIFLSDGRTGLRIESTEPGGFKPGDRLDVAGFPRVSDYNLTMEDAVCRRIGRQAPLRRFRSRSNRSSAAITIPCPFQSRAACWGNRSWPIARPWC
jgi:hypothetical protein